jgi:beta-lactam-binding protein with PASTA domain
MDFIKFLLSKTFIKNLIAAVIVLVLLVLGLKIYLNIFTHHNDYHLVPDLQKKSFEEAKAILEKRKMNIVIIDTVDYNPKFPKYSIVEQNPRKDDKVKVGRKIYVKINSSAYANVSFPKVVGKTKRQAIALLKATGLKPGEITTRPYFAEIVLYAIHQKDTLKTGNRVPKNSVINLIIGDGKRPINDDETSLDNDESDTNTDTNIQNVLDNVIGK